MRDNRHYRALVPAWEQARRALLNREGKTATGSGSHVQIIRSLRAGRRCHLIDADRQNSCISASIGRQCRLEISGGWLVCCEDAGC